MLTKTAAIKLADETVKANSPEFARLRRFARYARGKQPLPWMPDNVESEYRDIANKSQTNWLGLIIRSTVQHLVIDGYTRGDGEQSALWDLSWQRNGMDAKAKGLFRAVLSLGYSYGISFPAEGEGVWKQPVAATDLAAVYDDPFDRYPLHAVRVVAKDHLELYDDEARYTIRGSGTGRMVDIASHELGFCPVIKVRADPDLLGAPMGEIEPNIASQNRITDATFILQIVAKYGGFPQKWIAGIDLTKPLVDSAGEPLLDGDGNPVFPTIKAYIDHILTAVDPDTKFGQFTAADLGQYVNAKDSHIKDLAAVTQTPPHYLLGALVNLSAEALAAAESGMQRKAKDYRDVLGEDVEDWFRTDAAILGLEDEANDDSSQVHWQDVESRSLAQTSDALLKLHQLGVPLQVLIPMIPGLSQQDVAEAIAVIEAGGPMEQIAALLDNAQTSPPALVA